MSIADPRTIVLVHGAWHGGWCYRHVAKLLRQRGHTVFTPTFTGLGERSHLYSPAINLTTHVQDLSNVLTFEQLSDVVLVAHSYGGMAATKVADLMPQRLRSLIYLDAYLGIDDRCVFDMNVPDAAATQLDQAKCHGGHTIPPIPAAVFGVNPADRAWVDQSCTPQSLATFTERLSIAGDYLTIARRGYVLATGWQGSPFHAVRDRLRAEGGWQLRELECGHDVMLDEPEATAEIIEEWA